MADTVLLVAILLVLAVVVSGLFRRLPLPDSVVLVMVGLLLGGAGPPLAARGRTCRTCS